MPGTVMPTSYARITSQSIKVMPSQWIMSVPWKCVVRFRFGAFPFAPGGSPLRLPERALAVKKWGRNWPGRPGCLYATGRA